METLMLIMSLAKAMGFALVLTAAEPVGDSCQRFDDDAAIIICVDEPRKTASVHIFKILPLE